MRSLDLQVDVTEAAGGAPASYQVAWREVRGPLEAFGHERDITNSPVPAILPALGLSAAASPLVAVNNGYAVRNSDGLRLEARRQSGSAGRECSWSRVRVSMRSTPGHRPRKAKSLTPGGPRNPSGA